MEDPCRCVVSSTPSLELSSRNLPIYIYKANQRVSQFVEELFYFPLHALYLLAAEVLVPWLFEVLNCQTTVNQTSQRVCINNSCCRLVVAMELSRVSMRVMLMQIKFLTVWSCCSSCSGWYHIASRLHGWTAEVSDSRQHHTILCHPVSWGHLPCLHSYAQFRGECRHYESKPRKRNIQKNCLIHKAQFQN